MTPAAPGVVVPPVTPPPVGADPQPGEICMPGKVAGRLPSRVIRLTYGQYRNTLAALFGSLPKPPSPPGVPMTPILPEFAMPFEDPVGKEEARSLDFVLTLNSAETEALMDSSEILATALQGRLLPAYSCLKDWADVACLRTVFAHVGAILYRRPLEAATLDQLAAQYQEALAFANPKEAAKLTLISLLSSPRFLMRTELGAGSGALSGFEIADALAYSLTDRPPDAELLAAATGPFSKKETVKEAVVAQIDRLAKTGAMSKGFVTFAREYFTYDAYEIRVKPDLDHTLTQFGARGRQAARLSADLTVTAVLEDSPVGIPQRLLNTPKVMAHAAIDMLYGMFLKLPWIDDAKQACPTLADGRAFKVGNVCWYEFDGRKQGRAGMLTHPAFLGAFATEKENEFVRRGRFIRERMLCEKVPQPPETLADAVLAGMNKASGQMVAARDRFKVHAESPACAACHNIMDPFAYPLEAFDIFGRTRKSESVQGKSFTIDTSAELIIPGIEKKVAVKDAAEMATTLADSAAYKSCFIKHYTQTLLAREDACRAREATAYYMGHGENLMELVKWIFSDDRFLNRTR